MENQNLLDFEKRASFAYSEETLEKSVSLKESPESQREQWLIKNPTIITVS